MAVEGIANRVQDQADQIFRQKQETHDGTHLLGTGRAGKGAVSEDIFTPSTQNNSAQATAQDAGIFQVSQVALTEVTANILIGRTAANANQNAAPAQNVPAAIPNEGSAQTAAGNTDNPVTAALLFGANPAEQARTSVAETTTHVQDQIQALNAALPALGLTNAEILQIDRIATLIQNFNPAAFTNLVNQFEALAQQAAQQNAAIAAAHAAAVANPGATAGTNANGSGFQVQEIFIHFAGSQDAASNTSAIGGGQGSTANNIQITAASLQIEQVQFTLVNGIGQTVQVQAPQQSTNEGTADRQASQTHVAAA